MPTNTTIFKNEMSKLITARNISINSNTLPITEWPASIIDAILTQAKSAASIQCSIRNLTRDLAKYENHLATGTTPKALEYIFKKLYSTEEDIQFKAAMLEQAIRAEMAKITLKKKNLMALDTARLESLSKLLEAVVTACNLVLDPIIIKHVFEYQILQCKADFITRQCASEAKQAIKDASFTLAKEANANPAVITAKELKALNNTITNLNKKVAKLSTKAVPKKATGGKNRVNPAPQKSTGDTKTRNGKPKGSAKAKKSPGKNGK